MGELRPGRSSRKGVPFSKENESSGCRAAYCIHTGLLVQSTTAFFSGKSFFSGERPQNHIHSFEGVFLTHMVVPGICVLNNVLMYVFTY